MSTSALGRPFQLGMLYNMPSDTLITGLSLWDKKLLESSTRKSREVASDFEISASDSLDDRMKSIGVGGDLSLSIAVGLVKVGGSAKYVYSLKASSNVARMILRYSCTSYFEQLTMEQLGNIQYPEILEKQEATHVVTGIEYGADAFFVFETELQKREKKQEIQGKMEVQIARIPKFLVFPPRLEGEGEEKYVEGLESFSCKFYGDFLPDENPSTYQDAVKLYKQLPSLLGSDYENTVPKVVHLTPLYKLDKKQARVVRKINDSLVKQTHEAIESFEQIESRAQLLLKNETVGNFVKIRSSLERFKRTVESVKVRFIRQLADLIPQIRSGLAEEDELAGLTCTTSKMYFDSQVFSTWLDTKDQEVRCLEQYLDMAAEVEGLTFKFDFASFDLFVKDPRFTGTVIGFHFKIATKGDDPWLDQLSAVVESNEPLPELCKLPSASKWMTDVKIRSNLSEKMQKFLGLVKANVGQTSKVRFVITDSSEDEEAPDSKGALVMIYHHNEPGIELDPPGKPGKPSPVEGSITNSSLHLEWEEPVCDNACCKGGYLVYYRRVSDPANEWTITDADINKVEIPNLSSDECYVFKVVTDCGYFLGEESECSEIVRTHPAPSKESQMPEADIGRFIKRKISLPKPTKASIQDTERYRRGYPGKQEDLTINHNYEFYTNQRKSHPDGDFIDNIHEKWWGDYKKLDSHSYYIQWLFPIREKGTNSSAKELQPHEVKGICRDPKAMGRFLKSYEMMLNFYGLNLTDKQTGAIERSNNWWERFNNLNRTTFRSKHLQHITRILKSLGEFGFEHLKVPLIKHLTFAAVVEGTLENTFTSCMIYWVEVVKNDTEREGLHQYARELIQKVT